MSTDFVLGEIINGLSAELLMFGRPVSLVLYDGDCHGATSKVLLRRAGYGGRKGRSALRRVAQICRRYEAYERRIKGITYTVSLDGGHRITWIDEKGREHSRPLHTCGRRSGMAS